MKQGFFILAAIVVCLFVPCATSADTIEGRVVDAETGEPLEDAEVVFTETAVDDNSTISHTVRADSLGRFRYTCQMALSRLSITASYFGYHSQSLSRMGNDGRDTIAIDDFRLKMDEHLLSEVTVEGRIPRFYMRGDTVVFNPQAFRTQDGARLIELIEQLPGVSIEEGKLLWNGEPLRLMMNGQAAVSEELLANLLPVEAVKDIKAYDRQSELSARTGVADGKEQHVLDVVIKPSFMDKIYGDAEAKGVSSKYYASHLRAMRLSDTDPLLLYGRVADDPVVVDVTTVNRSGSHGGDEPVRQQTGAMGYGHLWKPRYKVRKPSFWSINGSANHTDRRNDSWENRLTFMPDSSATETDRTSRDYRHNLKLPVDFESFVNLSPNMMLSLDANVTYNREGNYAENHQQTYGAGLPEAPANASGISSQSSAEGIAASTKAQFLAFIGKTEFGALLALRYENSLRNGRSTGIYRYLQSGTTQTDCQRFRAPARGFKADMEIGARRPIGGETVLSTLWQTVYENNCRDEQRHRADTLDTANSLLRRDDTWRNTFHADANIALGKLDIKPSLDLTHCREQSDYRRGQLDTLAIRNAFFATPVLEITCKLQKQTRFTGRVAYESQQPDLIDCIGYRDDTNLLYITEGNPHLRASHTLGARLAFATMLARANQVLNLSVDYSKHYDPIGTVLHYSTATGGYRAQKRNVRGGERWSTGFSYERDLGRLRLKNNLNESYGRAYGIMTLVDDATGLAYNRQRSSDLEEHLKLEYADGPLLLRLNQDFGWHRYTYSDADRPRTDICSYRAELDGRYDWRSWTFSILPAFHSDRGHVADRMNIDRFLLNARIGYKFSKDKAQLILYANDLLNRDTRYHSAVTATTRTEGGTLFLHHYVSLTFSYKFK